MRSPQSMVRSPENPIRKRNQFVEFVGFIGSVAFSTARSRVRGPWPAKTKPVRGVRGDTEGRGRRKFRFRYARLSLGSLELVDDPTVDFK